MRFTCVRLARFFKVEPVCAVGARLCILLLVLTLYRYIGFSWGRSGCSGFGIVGLFLVCAYDLCCAGSIFCEGRAHGLLVHAACALLSRAYDLFVRMALPSAPVRATSTRLLRRIALMSEDDLELCSPRFWDGFRASPGS